MYAEQRTPSGWSVLGGSEPNDEHMTDADEIEPPTRPVAVYERRNRDLYALLVGVPGLTYDAHSVDVIAPPRGLPKDMSAELQTWYRYFEEEHPANSWLSLPELLNVD